MSNFFLKSRTIKNIDSIALQQGGLPTTVEGITAQTLGIYHKQAISHLGNLNSLRDGILPREVIDRLLDSLPIVAGSHHGPLPDPTPAEKVIHNVVLEGNLTRANLEPLKQYCLTRYQNQPQGHERSTVLYKKLIKAGLLAARLNFEKDPEQFCKQAWGVDDRGQLPAELDAAKQTIPTTKRTSTDKEAEQVLAATKGILAAKDQLFSNAIAQMTAKDPANPKPPNSTIANALKTVNSQTSALQEVAQDHFLDHTTTDRRESLQRKVTLDLNNFSNPKPEKNPTIPYLTHKNARIKDGIESLKEREELLKKLGGDQANCKNLLNKLEEHKRFKIYAENYDNKHQEEWGRIQREVAQLENTPLYTKNKAEIDKYLSLNSLTSLSDEWAQNKRTTDLLSGDFPNELSALRTNYTNNGLDDIRKKIQRDCKEKRLTHKQMDAYSKELRDAEKNYTTGIRASLQSKEAQKAFDMAIGPIQKIRAQSNSSKLGWRRNNGIQANFQVVEKIPEIAAADFPPSCQALARAGSASVTQLNTYIKEVNKSLEENKFYAECANEAVLLENKEKIERNKVIIESTTKEIVNLMRAMPYLPKHPKFDELHHVTTRLNDGHSSSPIQQVLFEKILDDPTPRQILINGKSLKFETKDAQGNKIERLARLPNRFVYNQLSDFLNKKITKGTKIGPYTLKTQEEADKFKERILSNVSRSKTGGLHIEFNMHKILRFDIKENLKGFAKNSTWVGRVLTRTLEGRTPKAEDFEAFGKELCKEFTGLLKACAKQQDNGEIYSNESSKQLNTEINSPESVDNNRIGARIM